MKEVTHIIHHADWDGIVAAWVAYNELQRPERNLTLHSINYGHQPPVIPEHQDVYILDFAFPPAVFVDFCAARTGRTVQLDHHKTAVEQYGLKTGTAIAYPRDSERSFVVFENAIAGCEMAMRYFHNYYGGMPSTSRAMYETDLVMYTADHDLWQFHLPHSKAIRAAMHSYPQTLASCQELAGKLAKDSRGLIEEGEAVLRYMEQQIDTACQHAELMQIHDCYCWGTQVPFDGLISEVAGRLATKEGGKFGVCWFKLQGAEWIYSLRSRNDFDVSDIAKAMGGGGHAQAAGFKSTVSPINFLAQQDEI